MTTEAERFTPELYSAQSNYVMPIIETLSKHVGAALDMVDSACMFSLNDERWNHLTGGYKTPFDPRAPLAKLENQRDTTTAWQELWDELHHQGDVGDASYAAIPELIRIHRNRGITEWDIYAITAIIELARTERGNPEVPEWLREDYFRSIQELAEMGAKEILHADDSETIRAILSVIAIAKGLRTHGKFLVGYSEDEMSAFEPR
jgi:hypothetical protein